jgi:hypothetical protein
MGTVASPIQAHKAKTFTIKPYEDGVEGEKITLYSKTGGGKTTLAAMAPNAVFIGLDDGARKIVNSMTGEKVNTVPGIEGFQDLRDALHQRDLFAPDATIVIDTVTRLEALMEPYIFQHYKQQGKTVTAMRGYGWDGPAHVLDCFRLLLSDLDAHVRVGRNVVLLAQLGQITVANAEGVDYLEDGPRLVHNKQYSVRNEVVEWSDHVLRIGYLDMAVEKDSNNAKVGKVQSNDATRAIYAGGAMHYVAKSRPIGDKRLPACISFAHQADNTLWNMVFEGMIPEVA